MSRGAGGVEREIERVFRDEPENALDVNDLCYEIFGEEWNRSKKVSVRRAAKKVCARLGWEEKRGSSGKGKRILFLICAM